MDLNFVKVYVREVHNEILGHEAFELLTLDHVKLRVVFEAAHQLVDS